MPGKWVEKSFAEGAQGILKGRKKLTETCKCGESQTGTKFDFIKPKECLADG
jgi:hypothetical protein